MSFFDLLSCPKYMNTIPLTICEILCILQKNLFRVTNTTTFVPILHYFLLECYISRIAGGASLNFQSWHQNYKNCYRKVLSVTARNKVKPGPILTNFTPKKSFWHGLYFPLLQLSFTLLKIMDFECVDRKETIEYPAELLFPTRTY